MADTLVRSRPIHWIATMLALGALALVIRQFSELQHFVELARHAQPRWLLLGIVLQSSTYACVALGWNSVLRTAGHALNLRRLYPVAVIKVFADQALPGAGLAGQLMLADRLTAMGIPRSIAVAAILVSLIGYYAAYALLAVLMLLALWLHRQTTPLLTSLVTAFLVIATALPALALWLRKRGSRPLPVGVEDLGPFKRVLALVGEAPAQLVGNRRLLARVTILSGVVFLADSATLMVCLMALAQDFAPMTAFIALMAGSIAATLAPLPLGGGSFEASCIAMLTLLGLRLEPAIAATLLLRGMTLWVPLLLGLIAWRRIGAGTT